MAAPWLLIELVHRLGYTHITTTWQGCTVPGTPGSGQTQMTETAPPVAPPSRRGGGKNRVGSKGPGMGGVGDGDGENLEVGSE